MSMIMSMSMSIGLVVAVGMAMAIAIAVVRVRVRVRMRRFHPPKLWRLSTASLVVAVVAEVLGRPGFVALEICAWCLDLDLFGLLGVGVGFCGL